MEYANVSVKFPRELDEEIERFIAETGIYTNKSEFIKEAVRTHLQQLNDDTAIAALRIEQLLARAEADSVSDDELHARLNALGDRVTAEDVPEAVDTAREETREQYREE